MRTLLLTTMLLTPNLAWGLSSPTSGWQFEIGGQLGILTTPVGVAPGGTIGASWWTGTYDDSYALGRWFSVGISSRFTTYGGQLLPTTLIEVRRGFDLMVVKPWFGVGVGTEFVPGGGVAPQARALGGVKYRVTPIIGVALKLDAGAALLPSGVAGRFGVSLCLDLAGPFKGRKK